ncbi:MAG TPA: class I SAM-dependent methyltransferase [Pseudonocardiaceae bacterium]|nr:class I SAM-dependent methyltransferase [Pseudonocardiaceae bacterium]
MTEDWASWHGAYDQPESSLNRRLAAVRRRIAAALDEQPPGRVTVISACAGQGRDLLGVLPDHPRRADVVGRLVELDPRNVEIATRSAEGFGVEVVEGDASLCSAYAGFVPADIVLMCGVFGNITDADIEHTVANLPRLCRTGGTVVWTRHTGEPDATPTIRKWFADNGFREVGFDTEPGYHYGVGTHTLTGDTLPFQPEPRLFDFRGYVRLATS